MNDEKQKPDEKSQPVVTIGVDQASGKDWSIYRCQCGYTANTARKMLIHQHEKHGGQRWT